MPASRVDANPQDPGRTALYLAAIGLSAFLLFPFELYAGRVVLPTFGGTPAVWTTALCFFSAVVFAGYSYAHALTARVGPNTAGLTHLALAGAALIAAFAAPGQGEVTPHAGVPPVLDVLAALARIAGAPVLLMATTTPLLSAWYAEDGSDPWWLYAASNAASLGGLLAYPLLVEPLVPLSMQRLAADAALVALTALLAMATLVRMRDRSARAAAVSVRDATPAPVRLRLWWVLAAAVPSGLLAATTTHLTTDHVSAPLLWVGPLSLYLGSFVVAFSRFGPRAAATATRLVPAAATLLWILYVARIGWPPLVLIPLMLVAYGVLAVALHGRLAAARPTRGHLTRFYLLVSAGGLVATAFVALAAPLLFNGVHEFPLLTIAGLAVLGWAPGRATPRTRPDLRALLRDTAVRLAPYVAVAAVLLLVASRESADAFALVALCAAIGFQVIGLSPELRSLTIASALAIAALMLAITPPYELRVRTFFGITEVRQTRDGSAREEIHGTTLHGLQFTDDRSDEPTSYFVRSGPLGDVFDQYTRRMPQGGSIGVVGLGIGTMTAYARDVDRLTFFEVDPAVARIAMDPRYFTYLRDSATEPRIVIGDGRLSLAAEPPASFDVLLLDAFSSDSVPAHLLTREALRTYAGRLRPGGVIVFQLTNRHFDLAPAVAATARSTGLDALTRAYVPPTSEHERFAARASRWLVVARHGDLAAFEALGWSRPRNGAILTDDYSDVLRLLGQ